MPMCGFTKEMLDGLDMLYEGLIKAVEKESIEQALGKEINDMHAFIGELDNLENSFDRQALMGITNLGQSLYRGAVNLSEQKGISLQESLREQKKHLRELFYRTDETYYRECENTANPMYNLIKKINEVK